MSRPAILHQTETVFAAALTSLIPGTVLEPCAVYRAQSINIDATVAPYAITVTASQPVEMGFEIGIFEVRVAVRLDTEIDESSSTPPGDLHHARATRLEEFLEDYDTLATLIADQPAPLSLMSFVRAAPLLDQTQQDRTLSTELVYFAELS